MADCERQVQPIKEWLPANFRQAPHDAEQLLKQAAEAAAAEGAAAEAAAAEAAAAAAAKAAQSSSRQASRDAISKAAAAAAALAYHDWKEAKEAAERPAVHPGESSASWGGGAFTGRVEVWLDVEVGSAVVGAWQERKCVWEGGQEAPQCTTDVHANLKNEDQWAGRESVVKDVWLWWCGVSGWPPLSDPPPQARQHQKAQSELSCGGVWLLAQEISKSRSTKDTAWGVGDA
jgi:hypothetical protein